MQVHYLKVTGRTNWMYLIEGEQGTVLLVDAYEPPRLKQYLAERGIVPSRLGALTTHGHADHNAGNPQLEAAFPGIVIYAGSNRSHTHRVCQHNDLLEYPDLHVRCLHVPCHTADSFAYFVQSNSSSEKGLFVGDTLFYLGCGKFFEGTPQMMQRCFDTLMSCPGDTTIYPGHDYNENNLRFRQHLLGEALAPSDSRFLTVDQEKKDNPFINTELLAGLPEFAALSPLDRLALLRAKKDDWS